MTTVNVLFPQAVGVTFFQQSRQQFRESPERLGQLTPGQLSEASCLESLECRLELTVLHLEALDPALNVTSPGHAATVQQQARQKVVEAVRDLEERLVLYLKRDFATLASQSTALEEGA